MPHSVENFSIHANGIGNDSWNRVVVVLDGCVVELSQSMEKAKKRLRQNVEKDNRAATVLDGDANKRYISNVLGKDPALYRLDILHHCLLQLLDSPLCLAGFLEVYLKLDSGDLVRVDPRFECPLVFDEFRLVLAELLVFKHVKAQRGQGNGKTPLSLLRIVKNPLTDHLPQCQTRPIYVFSIDDGVKLVKLKELVLPTVNDTVQNNESASGSARQLNVSPVFVIGGFRKGTINVSYWKSLGVESCAEVHEVKIYESEVSSGLCCAKICHEYERALGL